MKEDICSYSYMYQTYIYMHYDVF